MTRSQPQIAWDLVTVVKQTKGETFKKQCKKLTMEQKDCHKLLI